MGNASYTPRPISGEWRDDIAPNNLMQRAIEPNRGILRLANVMNKHSETEQRRKKIADMREREAPLANHRV